METMKKRRKLLVPLFVSLSLVYVIVAARPLRKELQFLPQWTVDATKVTAPDNADFSAAIPFRLGQTAGYFTADGSILRVITFPYKAAISPAYYAPYGTSDRSIAFFASDGTKAGDITRAGFPFFWEDKQYLFLPGGAAFAKLDGGGQVQWTYEGYAPITAFSSSQGGCVAGYADGTVVAFTDDGAVAQQFAPGGSAYPVILGADVSASGALVACVSGQDEQRLVIAKKSSNHTEIIHHEYLPEQATRQRVVRFSRDESTVYYDRADGIGVTDCKTGKSRCIPLRGNILSVQESDTSRTVFVLSKAGSTYTVHVIEPFAISAGSFSFEAQAACMMVRGDDLFVGRNGSISCIRMVRR